MVRRPAGGGTGRRRPGVRLAPPRREPGPLGAERRGRRRTWPCSGCRRPRDSPPPPPTSSSPAKAAAASVLGTEGRFAIYHPALQLRRARGHRPARPERVHHPPERPGLRLHRGQHLRRGHRLPLHRHARPLRPGPGVFTPLRLRTLLTGPSQLAPEVPSSGVVAERARSLPGGPAGRHGQGADVVLRPSPHAHRGHAGHPGRAAPRRRWPARGWACSGREASSSSPALTLRAARRPRHRRLPLARGRCGPGRPGEPPGGVGHLRGHHRRRPPVTPWTAASRTPSASPGGPSPARGRGTPASSGHRSALRSGSRTDPPAPPPPRSGSQTTARRSTG